MSAIWNFSTLFVIHFLCPSQTNKIEIEVNYYYML